MLANYCFVIDGVLAGCAMPGQNAPLIADLEEARRAGVTDVVSLTEAPLPNAVIQEVGMGYRHIPVEDFTAPTLEQVEEFVSFVDEVRQRGGAVLVHCHGGYGRTGTMLAAYLIKDGKPASDAVQTIRRARPGSIETTTQERVLHKYEARLRKSER